MKTSFYTACIATLLTSTALSDNNHYTTDTGCKVDIGASAFVEAATRLQSKENSFYDITKNNSDIGFNTAVDVHLTLTYEAKNNWNYGLQSGLFTNVRSNSKAGKHYLDRTYIWADNDDFGKIEIGGNVSSANGMMITKGKAGSWQSYASLDTSSDGTTGVDDSNFLKSSKLVLKEGSFEQFGSHERSRKVTYYTPKYEGFQLGISYIPDVTNSSNPTTAVMPNTQTSNRQESNAVALGVTWQKKIDSKQKVEFAIVGETAKPKRSNADKSNNRLYHRSKAIALGGLYKYDNLELALSYGNHWKTNTQKISNIPNAFFYQISASYDITDKTNLNGSAFYSEKFDNPMVVTAMGLDYKLAPGLKPYAKVVYFNMNQKQNYSSVSSTANGDSTLSSSKFRNEGTVFILGSKINF